VFLCGSQIKEGLFPCTPLPDWFFIWYNPDALCLLHVRAASFNISQVTFSFQNRAVAQAVSRRFLTADVSVRS
jgi:hypothetical protein